MPSKPFRIENSVFFLYDTQLLEVQAPNRKKSYFYGGRGIGKTAFLARLQTELLPDTAYPPLAGRHWGQTYQALGQIHADIANEKPLRHLLFDDLDHFCRHGIDKEGREFEHVIDMLDGVIKGLVANDKRVVVTGTVAPKYLIYPRPGTKLSQEELLALTDFWSDIDLYWDHSPFDPWEYHWKTQFRDAFTNHFEPLVTALLSEIWWDVILELTGGHPSLLGLSIIELVRLTAEDTERTPLESKIVDPQAVSPDDDLPALIRQHLENHLVRTGLSRVKRAIKALRESKEADFIASYEYLQRLAQGERVMPPYQVREILTDEALVYEDKETGEYKVPGALIGQEILRYQREKSVSASPTAEALPERLLEVIPEPQFPEERGTLVAAFGLDRVKISLSGGPWKILKVLNAAQGRILSLAELTDETGLDSETAVRSAIQRLNASIKKENLQGIIINVHGRGYRLGDAPEW